MAESWLKRALRRGKPAAPKLALNWELGEDFGWGLSGVHIALHLVERGTPPLVVLEPKWASLRPENRDRLAMLRGVADDVRELVELHAPNAVVLEDYCMLHALLTGFAGYDISSRVRGSRNLGVIAFENARLEHEDLQRARGWDGIVVHSSYNRDLLREHGIEPILALQGIDPGEMHPRARSGRYAGRFVVYSGGKLEFRKGQDIVLAAFARFHSRHPEALLVTVWDNLWPESAFTMSNSPWARVAPTVGRDGRLRIADWALANGVPQEAFVDLGHVTREQLAALLAECDAAVFPNRCEGGTNIVAMEAMACGVPVVLSANTGHLDIIAEERCLILRQQGPVPDPGGRTSGWGESSVDEMVAHLESIYSDGATARARARKAVEFMQSERTWQHFARRLVDALA
jgi:glycosyltransferase involved in cell wall biosynthesis